MRRKLNKEDYAPRDGWRHVPAGAPGSCWVRRGLTFFPRIDLHEDEILIPSPRDAREAGREIRAD